LKEWNRWEINWNFSNEICNKSNGRRCVYNIKKDLKEIEITALMWSVKGDCEYINKAFASITGGKFRMTAFLDIIHRPVF
jgi:hypothetical protein